MYTISSALVTGSPLKREASQKETLVITVKCLFHEVKKVVSGEILSHSQEEYMYNIRTARLKHT
jgi:hypothetical protein